MMNYIWFFILCSGIIFGTVTGRGEVISQAVVNSSGLTVKLIIELGGILSVWCGVIKIAEKSGLTERLAGILRPLLKRLFTDASRDEKALGNIVMNLTSNMMGLSNAATPFGIKAMEDMQRLNKKKETASNDMALFLVLNAACIQFIPAVVISIRAACGSANPGEIIAPAVITTTAAAVVGVISCKILEKYNC